MCRNKICAPSHLKALSPLVTLRSCYKKVTKLKKLSGHARRIEILASTHSKKAPSCFNMLSSRPRHTQKMLNREFFLAACLEIIKSIVTLEKPHHAFVMMRVWQERDKAFLSVTIPIFYFYTCSEIYLFDQFFLVRRKRDKSKTKFF